MVKIMLQIHALFFLLLLLLLYKQRFFSAQHQCRLTFSWIELQILPLFSFIRINIIILRHFLYLVYLFPCLVPGLFLSYHSDLFFIFILIFISINCIISLSNFRSVFPFYAPPPKNTRKPLVFWYFQGV